MFVAYATPSTLLFRLSSQHLERQMILTIFIDYYALNKEQPLHLNIKANPNQIELDSEKFDNGKDTIVMTLV
jgi:hypothetical protein